MCRSQCQDQVNHVKVLQRGNAIGPDSEEEKLHDLRKTCKMFRYLIELYRPYFDDETVAGMIASRKLNAPKKATSMTNTAA